MTDSTIAELARKNQELRQLVTRLSAIVLRDAVERRELAARAPQVLMTPIERVARLREFAQQSGQLRGISLRLMQMGLACRNAQAADGLKGLAAAFAAEAGRVDALISTARG